MIVSCHFNLSLSFSYTKQNRLAPFPRYAFADQAHARPANARRSGVVLFTERGDQLFSNPVQAAC